MSKNMLFIILIAVSSNVFCEIKQRKNPCTVELVCGDRSEFVTIAVQGLPGHRGSEGSTGPIGSIGPQGLQGPPGRDGFVERPPSFYAELPNLFITKNRDSIIQPWTLSDSFNVPEVSNYFSSDTGIFIAPTPGFYQFFLTISVFQSKAIVYITKNNKRMCTISIASNVIHSNKTIAWGWSSNSIDCLIYCQINDQISAVASYHLNEKQNSQIYGYSYSIFSGYMLSNN